jgi:hypothetical protein
MKSYQPRSLLNCRHFQHGISATALLLTSQRAIAQDHAILAFVRKLRDKGCRIDVIGSQFLFDRESKPKPAFHAVAEKLKKGF